MQNVKGRGSLLWFVRELRRFQMLADCLVHAFTAKVASGEMLLEVLKEPAHDLLSLLIKLSNPKPASHEEGLYRDGVERHAKRRR